MEISKILEVWLSECMIRVTPQPISSLDLNSPEWSTGLWISGAQAYPAYRSGILPNSDGYANISFEGLREWLMKHSKDMPIDELPELTAATQWYPLHWISVKDSQAPSNPQVWDWYQLGFSLSEEPYPSERVATLTPYDVLSIPLSTFITAIQKDNSLNISVANSNGLTIIVRPRIADRYHPELQVVLD